MGQYEELIKLLKIENQEQEKEMLRLWIEQVGIEEVYEQCLILAKNPEKFA